jgi:hypothetical protein
VLSFLVTSFFTRVKKEVTRSSAGGVEALAQKENIPPPLRRSGSSGSKENIPPQLRRSGSPGSKRRKPAPAQEEWKPWLSERSGSLSR